MNKIVSKHLTLKDHTNTYTPIDNNNWNYESDVEASFQIRHNENKLHLSFKINESNTKAIYTNYNDAVWEDSCVEFFISFDKKHYYNFEFNCIGTILGGYGTGKQNRTEINLDFLKQIETTPSLGRNKIEIINRPTEWNLEVNIPKEVFCFDEIKSFNGIKATGNFYKCGDNQKQIHFLSWNPIKCKVPNFHLPGYFGEINFE